MENKENINDQTGAIEKGTERATQMVLFFSEKVSEEEPESHQLEKSSPSYTQYNYADFAKEFMARNSIVKIQGILYLYLQERGYYHPLVIGASDIPIRMQMPIDMQNRCSNTTINEMIKWLYAWTGDYCGNYNHSELVNFKNGYLDIKSGKLYSHSSSKIFTYVVRKD